MATEIFHVTLFVLAFWHSTRAVVVSANLSSVWQPDERIITLPESLLAEDIPDYVPPSVKCVKKKLCDEHKICATVCERGYVGVLPCACVLVHNILLLIGLFMEQNSGGGHLASQCSQNAETTCLSTLAVRNSAAQFS